MASPGTTTPPRCIASTMTPNFYTNKPPCSSMNEITRQLIHLTGSITPQRLIPRESVRSYPCSKCGAKAGENCLRKNGRLRIANHIERVALALGHPVGPRNATSAPCFSRNEKWSEAGGGRVAADDCGGGQATGWSQAPLATPWEGASLRAPGHGQKPRGAETMPSPLHRPMRCPEIPPMSNPSIPTRRSAPSPRLSPPRRRQ